MPPVIPPLDEIKVKEKPAEQVRLPPVIENKLPFSRMDSSSQSLLEVEDISDGKGGDGSDSDRLIPLEEEEPE